MPEKKGEITMPSKLVKPALTGWGITAYESEKVRGIVDRSVNRDRHQCTKTGRLTGCKNFQTMVMGFCISKKSVCNAVEQKPR